MQERTQFYIDGRWVDPVKPATLDVIDPSTEQVIGLLADEEGGAPRAAVNTDCYGNSPVATDYPLDL